jgi:hypothetical protein
MKFIVFIFISIIFVSFCDEIDKFKCCNVPPWREHKKLFAMFINPIFLFM